MKYGRTAMHLITVMAILLAAFLIQKYFRKWKVFMRNRVPLGLRGLGSRSFLQVLDHGDLRSIVSSIDRNLIHQSLHKLQSPSTPRSVRGIWIRLLVGQANAPICDSDRDLVSRN